MLATESTITGARGRIEEQKSRSDRGRFYSIE
jgi:hypothetical protein